VVRPKKIRFVGVNPIFRVFKPAGIQTDSLENVEMTLDEFEAIRLVDFEGLDHLEASELIGVSRPTLSRLVERSRKKIADALVNGKALVIEGGIVEFVNHQRCGRCGKMHPGFGGKNRKNRCCGGNLWKLQLVL